jgi:two-component system, OmpR family, response regulator CpxR
VTKLLLIDDDVELCALLRTFLKDFDFDVTVCHDGRDGLQHALQDAPAIVVLDVMMPVLDGFEVLRQIRRRSAVPVILLTARIEHGDRMQGFQAGADDYLPKPFHPEELMARCRAMVRRTAAKAHASETVTQVGGLRLDAETRRAWADDEPLDITSMEFEILDILARGAGRIVSRDEIWAAIHQREPSPFERALDTHMSNVRKKIAGRGQVTIRTVRNTGYILAATEA